MKKRIESAMLLAVASVLITSQAEAQLVLKPSKIARQQAEAKSDTEMIKTLPSKSQKDQAKAPSTTSTIKTRPVNKAQLLGGLGIQKFEASRAGDGILISATVSNTSSEPISFYFRVSRQTGSKWSQMNDGWRLIGPKDQVGFNFSFPRTNNAMKFKFEIDGGNDTAYFSKECRLAARPTNFVVRYGTSGEWVEVRTDRDDLSDGFDASEFARLNLRPLGLDTKIGKRKFTDISDPFSIQTKLLTSLYVRSSVKLSRSFGTRNEAVQFRRTLLSLVPDGRFTVESVHEQEL